MAITPNVSQEQQNKLNLRAQTRGGTSPTLVNPPIDEAILVNAAATTSGILELSIPTGNTSFAISGSNGLTTATITGTATGNNVNYLVSQLSTTALSGTAFFVNAGGANFLNGSTVDIVVPTGATLTVVSATGTAPTITAFTLSGTLGTTYPNYVGTPNATPNWIDDVTAHNYIVGFNGQIVGGTQLTNGVPSSAGALIAQQQVRQIVTQPSETQQYGGYYATYSGNLTQTAQKNTKRQQG